MSDENSFTVKLPVRQLPDGMVRVGHEPAPSGPERFTFPVVPDQPEVPMSDTEASPGPWRKCGDDRGGCKCGHIWSITSDRAIAQVLFEDEEGEHDPKRVQANADLIALAPTMASMLLELEWKGEFDGSYACAVCSALAPGYYASETREGFGVHTEDCKLAAILSELRRP